jgi:hypothetical protein
MDEEKAQYSGPWGYRNGGWEQGSASAASMRNSKSFSSSVPVGTSHLAPDGGRAPVLRTFGAHAPVLTNRRASNHRTSHLTVVELLPSRQSHSGASFPQWRYPHEIRARCDRRSLPDAKVRERTLSAQGELEHRQVRNAVHRGNPLITKCSRSYTKAAV